MNADKAKEVGEKVLCSMLGKNIHDHSFRKKDQVKTLASKSAVRFSEGSIEVDPQLLFQRLTIVTTGGRYENPQAFFKFEMCSYPNGGLSFTVSPGHVALHMMQFALYMSSM